MRSLVASEQRLQSLSGLSIWKHIQHLQGIPWPEGPGLSRELCMSPHCAVFVPGKTGENPAPALAKFALTSLQLEFKWGFCNQA